MKTVNIMKNYKVSEDFIKEAHNAACSEWKQKIEVQFPDVFRPEVEPGKWYKFGNAYLVCIQELNKDGVAKVYGFHNGEWYAANEFQAIGGWFKPTEATDREVELALTEEAYRLGYKEGVVINSILFPGGTYTMNHCKPFLCSGNRLLMGGGLILKDGNWAQIAKEERTHKVGDKIIIDDDETYLICRVGTNTISLVSSAGESWDYTVQVINENKITQQELNDHIGDYKWELV